MRIHGSSLFLPVIVTLGLAACGDDINYPAVHCSKSPDADDSTEKGGRIFIDKDKNGVFSAGDVLAPGVLVFFETGLCEITNEEGRYTLPIQDKEGIVWVRGTDDMAPGPHWRHFNSGETLSVDFPIPPNEREGVFSFVVGSDTHAGIKEMSVEDQIVGLAQASAQVNKPAFIAITGDITQSNEPKQFSSILGAIDDTGIPFVPVPGNHDWYDGGAAYRKYFGPPTYSFDSGGAHFIIINDVHPLGVLEENRRQEFLALTISKTTQTQKVFVLMHAPPSTDLLQRLKEHQIDFLLTGHMHANRVLEHGPFIEYNTQPLVMGGVDKTPSGYRVFTKKTDGDFRVEHRHIVNKPFTTLLSPAENNHKFERCRANVIVSAGGGPAIREMKATITGVGQFSLVREGDWTFRSDDLAMCTQGVYDLTVDIEYVDNTTKQMFRSMTVESKDTIEVTDWPMHQGEKTHKGQAHWEHPMPEHTRWVTTVGGTINSGSPIVADGKIFISISDFGSGLAGGIVALDFDTGETLWEHRIGSSVRNAAAAAFSRVMFISNDGVLHCLDAKTGDSLWNYEIAPRSPAIERSLYSAPTIDGNMVIAGGGRELVAIDIESGDVLWSQVPISGSIYDSWSSHASPAISGDVVVATFNRKGGLHAFDRQLGTKLWDTSWEPVLGVQGSPIIVDDKVYVVNELLELTALDLLTGEKQWTRSTLSGLFGWGYFSGGTPAVGAKNIFLPSLKGELVAVDLATGALEWTFLGGPSPIRSTHYHGVSPALSSAPIYADGKVWIAGNDGFLRALNAETGDVHWEVDIGTPMTSSPTLVGDLVIVSTLGGTVHALTHQ